MSGTGPIQFHDAQGSTQSFEILSTSLFYFLEIVVYEMKFILVLLNNISELSQDGGCYGYFGREKADTLVKGVVKILQSRQCRYNKHAKASVG